MRNAAPILMSVAILAVGCSSSGLPQPGDTVSPRIVNKLQWEPGNKVDLRVELSAKETSGNSRQLSFRASPKKNPVARVHFYDATGAKIKSQDVELSIRC